VNEGARGYAGFGDFHFYRLKVERAHLVAGFGRIHWLDAPELALPGLDPAAFAHQAEASLPQLLERLGSGGLARLAVHAGAPSGRTPVTLAAIDPEGCDLLVGNRRRRLDFEQPQVNLKAAEAAVLALAEG
ncbi:MAG: HugZ family protein, partial [Kiloniellales bacterium]